MPNPPLIITLLLERKWQAHFNELRKQHFPAHCNYMDAHLTLFHCLPTGNELVNSSLQQLSQRECLLMEVTGLKNMGNGVAFELHCPALQQLHKTMQQQFSKLLIRKDRQVLRPHITVQNKVTAFKALQTFNGLQQDFRPFPIKGIGLSTWHYLKGPWQHVKDYPFLVS
jgi:2'-5' RNA ligase